jgi:hypothetical protein
MWPTETVVLLFRIMPVCWYFLKPACSIVAEYFAGGRFGIAKSPDGSVFVV